MRILTLHEYDADRVTQVMENMKTLGSPVIRAVNCGDHYQAIEGTHRLISAARLGLPIVIDEIDPDETIDADTLDWGTWDDEPRGFEVAAEASRLGWRTARALDIDGDGRVELLEP